MGDDKRELVDHETGEIVYALVPLVKKHLRGGFFMAMQEGFAYLAKSDLTLQETKVLHYLFSKIDFENWLRISQIEIAKELRMKPQNVSKSIRHLVERGILHKGPKVGTSWTYRLDPNFGVKGKARNIKRIESEIKSEAKKRGFTVIKGNKNR